jgi:hypothetical protein
MKLNTMRKWTIILPVLSFLLSTGIVVHEYYLRSLYKHELQTAMNRVNTLAKQLPPDKRIIRLDDDD